MTVQQRLLELERIKVKHQKKKKQQAEKICHEQGKRIRSNNSCVNNREDKIKVDKIMLTRFGKLKKHHCSRETKGSCFS